MINLVNWNALSKKGNDIATEFINLANLNEIDAKIIIDRKNKRTQRATSQTINKSVEWITKRIKTFLIPKYKEVSKIYPDILPLIETGYTNVNAIVTIEYNDQTYSVSLQNDNKLTFDEIHDEVVEKIKEKYDLDVNTFSKYTVFVGGSYTRINE